MDPGQDPREARRVRRRTRADVGHARTRPPTSPATTRSAMNLSLDPATKLRLEAWALAQGKTASQVVSEWVDRECRSLVFYLRGQGQGQEPTTTPDAPGSTPAG